MMINELWPFFVGLGGLLTPIVLAALARDRYIAQSMVDMANQIRKERNEALYEIGSRISRTRDEFEKYVRRDDFSEHLTRIDRSIEGVLSEIRRSEDRHENRFAEIKNLLKGAKSESTKS